MNTFITTANTNLIGSFESYLQSVYSTPLLSAEEEHELACRFYNNQDIDAAHKLVFSHIKFVVKIARNYMNVGLNMQDLIQEGTVGLMKAVRNFNPFHGVRLASFALHWIKSEIHEFILKNWSLVKIATTKSQRKLFFNLHKFTKTTKYFSVDDINQISDFLQVPEKEVSTMIQRMASKGDTYTDELENSDNLLVDNNSNHAMLLEEQDWKDHRENMVQKAIQALDTRSQIIIKERWLAGDKKASLKDLAQRFDVSLARINQIEKHAVTKLRSILSELLKYH